MKKLTKFGFWLIFWSIFSSLAIKAGDFNEMPLHVFIDKGTEFVLELEYKNNLMWSFV